MIIKAKTSSLAKAFKTMSLQFKITNKMLKLTNLLISICRKTKNMRYYVKLKNFRKKCKMNLMIQLN